MSRKNDTHITFLEPEILAMKESGKTKRGIAEPCGLKMEQVKELLKRYHRRERKIIAGIQPQSQGRARKDGPNHRIQLKTGVAPLTLRHSA